MQSTVAKRLETGARIAEWIAACPEDRRWRWRDIVVECFGLQYTSACRVRLSRCYSEWKSHSGGGAFTQAGAGAMQRGRCRRAAVCPRQRKLLCLWFELLQWYVDEVESLRTRADSALVMKHARLIRGRLLDQGYEAALLPKINKQFLFRWRQEYGIAIRKSTVQFKVHGVQIRTYVRRGGWDGGKPTD